MWCISENVLETVLGRGYDMGYDIAEHQFKQQLGVAEEAKQKAEKAQKKAKEEKAEKEKQKSEQENKEFKLKLANWMKQSGKSADEIKKETGLSDASCSVIS